MEILEKQTASARTFTVPFPSLHRTLGGKDLRKTDWARTVLCFRHNINVEPREELEQGSGSFVRMYDTRCEAWEKEMLFERVTRRGGRRPQKWSDRARGWEGSWSWGRKFLK